MSGSFNPNDVKAFSSGDNCLRVPVSTVGGGHAGRAWEITDGEARDPCRQNPERKSIQTVSRTMTGFSITPVEAAQYRAAWIGCGYD
jgi:hypothetical protein